MLTTQDEKRVRMIVREEIVDLKTDVTRSLVMLEEQGDTVKAIAEKMDFMVARNKRIEKLENRVGALEVDVKVLKSDR